MLKVLLSLLLTLTTAQALAQETVVLNDETTVTFRGVVDSASVTRAQADLIKKAAAGKPLTLVLETPGGSVDAGNRLIDTIRGLPVRVNTITLFAASMGFNIAQASGDRMIIPNGELMSHRASGGVGGEMPGNLITRLNHWLIMLDSMHDVSAKRMGLSLAGYHVMIRDEYWTFGARAVREKAADKVVLARCGPTLAGTDDVTFNTMFGPVKVTFSKCPLVVGALAVSFEAIDKENRAEVTKYINLLLTNKPLFYARYIRNGNFQEFQN